MRSCGDGVSEIVSVFVLFSGRRRKREKNFNKNDLKMCLHETVSILEKKSLQANQAGGEKNEKVMLSLKSFSKLIKFGGESLKFFRLGIFRSNQIED